MSIINIFCDKASKQAIKIFKKSGFHINSELETSELLWIRKRFQDYLKDLHDNQVINHLPGESQVTTKGKLTNNLKAKDSVNNGQATHEKSNNTKSSKKKKKKQIQAQTNTKQESPYSSRDFYKESYLLYDKDDLRAFFNNTRDRNDSLWVLKPTTLSKGCGVRIIEDLADLKETIINKDKPEYKEKYEDYFCYDDEEYDFIIQRHIDNPLLLANKKSEIRVYWIVLSIEPLSVIFYNDAIVRLCSEDYAAGDYSNPLKHITNIFQQKKFSDNFKSDDLKWSMAMLHDEVVRQGLTLNQDVVNDEIMTKIRPAISYIISSAQKNILKTKLFKQHKHLSAHNFFGLYGCDIMLDQNLQPWVLEVQKGPGLAFDHQHKAEVLMPMAKNGLEIIHKYKFSDDSKFALPDKYSWLIYKGKQVSD